MEKFVLKLLSWDEIEYSCDEEGYIAAGNKICSHYSSCGTVDFFDDGVIKVMRHFGVQSKPESIRVDCLSRELERKKKGVR